MLTGFRVGPAGWWGLEAARADGEPWRPDLVTFGKVVGGGLPLAAVAGRAEVMELLAPLGPVYQAGTLSGNPLAVAAGLATLRGADAAVYERIDRSAARLSARSRTRSPPRACTSRSRAPAASSRSRSATGPCGITTTRRRRMRGDMRPFFTAMLEQGVSLPPSVFEAWFLSAAHTDVELDRIVAALPAAVRAAADAPRPHRAG